MADYEIVVVGAGMFGSAAAKYISTENQHCKVALIGPSEPERKQDATIHGAHYDEGRTYRTCDKDMIWGVAGKRSVESFHKIEQLTGIELYKEVGYLLVAPTGSQLISQFKKNAGSLKVKFNFLKDSREVGHKYPYMDFGENIQGFHIPSDSGYLNPRNLIKAQIMLAARAGCVYIDDVVDSIKQRAGLFELHLSGQGLVRCHKVLLATGAFTHCRDLLPRELQPSITKHPETVILIEIEEFELKQFEGMPCIVYKGGKWDQPGLNLVAYILPPIKYPDGKHYLKVGHGRKEPCYLHSPEELTRWYHNGKDDSMNAYLYDVARTIFPDINMRNTKYDYCVTTRTNTGYPYIDMIGPNLGVVLGGCGQGAKSSDEFGRIAARLISKGHWDHDFPEKYFKFEHISKDEESEKCKKTNSKL